MTPDTIRILTDAFTWGANNSEACLLANISEETFYAHLRNNPDFSDRINIAKNLPILNAKKTVHEAAKTDKQSAQWLLERRRKEEYAPRQELSGPEGLPLGYIHSGDLKQLNESDHDTKQHGLLEEGQEIVPQIQEPKTGGETPAAN